MKYRTKEKLIRWFKWLIRFEDPPRQPYIKHTEPIVYFEFSYMMLKEHYESSIGKEFIKAKLWEKFIEKIPDETIKMWTVDHNNHLEIRGTILFVVKPE